MWLCAQESTDDGFERAAVGLAVCLTVAVLYAAVATAMVVYDCLHKLREQRKKRAERDLSLAHSTAVIASQTAASSALKPRQSAAASAHDRTTAVRFTDNSLPTFDITC